MLYVLATKSFPKSTLPFLKKVGERKCVFTYKEAIQQGLRTGTVRMYIFKANMKSTIYYSGDSRGKLILNHN